MNVISNVNKLLNFQIFAKTKANKIKILKITFFIRRIIRNYARIVQKIEVLKTQIQIRQVLKYARAKKNKSCYDIRTKKTNEQNS